MWDRKLSSIAVTVQGCGHTGIARLFLVSFPLEPIRTFLFKMSLPDQREELLEGQPVFE